MLSDLKYALRQMAKFPGYTLTVVLTLAFGIAVNTQIFDIATGLFLRPMPARDASKLVAIVQRNTVINIPYQVSFQDFQDIRAGSKALKDHIAFFSTPAHVSIPGKIPERIAVEAVTPDAFTKLGITVALGRPLQPADGEMSTNAPVTVLTDAFWKSHFGGDPAAIGRTVVINSKPFTVVGVAKPGFESFSYMFSSGMFVSSGAAPRLRSDGDNIFKYRGYSLWRILAYLPDGSSVSDANAELAVFASRFAKEFPDSHRNAHFQAVLESHARPDPALIDFAPVFAALFFGLVVLVLFIACANVTNLMSGRALAREKELVVRAAVGASRWHLMRQLLVESVLLALIAGLVGYGLANWGQTLFAQFQPSDETPLRIPSAFGWSGSIFTAAVSLLAGIGSGLFPALRSSRIDLNEGLKQGGARQAGGGSHRMRNMLVVGQVAMSCVVLISAVLFLRGLRTARNFNFGFRSDHVIMMSVDLSLQGYAPEKGLRFQKEILEKVRAVPGVLTADFTQHVPFGNNLVIRDCYPDNPSGNVPDGHTTVALSAVTPGFAKNFGVTFLRGRDLAATDDEKAPPVAVINEAMAKAFWPGKDPIGQHFHRDWQGGPAIEVVGVVATGKYIMISEDARPFYYLPYAQAYEMPCTLVVRTQVEPQSLAHTVREIIRNADGDLPVYGLLTLEDHIGRSGLALMPLRMGAMLAGIQGGIGLVLAILGLYSVVSYDVTSRTREIGVRIALGATESNILRFVSREGTRLTLTGMAAGLVMAVLLSIGLSRILIGVKPADPVAFLLTTVALAGTAALACLIPARRATRVNPVDALRAE